MQAVPAYSLPSFYSDWLGELLPGPIPSEPKATCDNCAMVPKPDEPPMDLTFDPVVRCCTYEPNIANYRLGRILNDDDPSLAPGRASIEERIRRRIAITPLGAHQSPRYHLLYTNATESFGRAPALRCPHLAEDGGCSIWKHRPAVCSTWFCKHARGATGKEFWAQLNALLNTLDADLSLWCAAELGAVSGGLLRDVLPERTHLKPGDLEGAFDDKAYAALWQTWQGRELEFYRQCAALVEPLRWSDIANLCGPRVRALATLLQEAYSRLTSAAIPERLQLGRYNIEGLRAGGLLITTYSGYDPLVMSNQVAKVLPYFDGRPTAEALDNIRRDLHLTLNPGLLRRMVDFGILQSAEPFPILL